MSPPDGQEDPSTVANERAGRDHFVWYCGLCACDRPPTPTSACGTCGAPLVVRDSRRQTQDDAKRKWKDIVRRR